MDGRGWRALRAWGKRLLAFVTGSLVTCLLAVGAPVVSSASTNVAPSVEPSFGPPLNMRMASLFHDLQLNSLALSERLFFPESAYVSMKRGQIPSPPSDYVNRLIGFLRLDLNAYHSFIFARGRVTYLGTNVNPSYATWVRPGWCENSIGYWHVPGVRLVYSVNGVVRSVAVASLISWRGIWYVVHLGPNPRPRDVGTVDAPRLGRGVAGPAGGC